MMEGEAEGVDARRGREQEAWNCGNMRRERERERERERGRESKSRDKLDTLHSSSIDVLCRVVSLFVQVFVPFKLQQ